MKKSVPILQRHKDLPYSKILFCMQGGSSLEKTDELGYAHLIEHLLFKLKVGKTGIAEFAESIGGYSNAYTSHDDVVVEISLTNEYVERCILFLKTIFEMELTEINEDDFREERGVVLEEMLMYDDEPTEILFQELMKNQFQAHPYGRKIIGEEVCLKSATLRSLNEFYRTKMLRCPFIVVVGGHKGELFFEIDEVTKPLLIDMGNWDVEDRFVLRHKQAKDYVIAGWRLEHETGMLAAINKLIYTITYGMDGGRLYNKIVYDSGLFDNLSLSFVGGHQATLFVQIGAFSPSKEKKRIEKWLTIWDDMRFTQFEVAKAKEVILSNKYFNSEGIGSAPYHLAKSYIMYNDPEKYERDYFYYLFNCTASDLNAFKDEFLGVEKAVLGISLPEKSKFTFNDLQFVPGEKTIEDEPFIRKRKKGVRLSAYDRKSSPFLSGYLLKKSGVLADKRGKEGGFNLFIETFVSSAKDMTRDETEAYLDRFGITFSAMSGNNTGGVKIKVRDSFVEEGFEILRKVLDNPLREEDFVQEKQFALSNFSLQKEEPTYILKEEIHKRLFPGTHYEFLIGGTEESLENITFDDMLRIRKEFMKYGHWGVGLSGAFSKKEQDGLLDFLTCDTEKLIIPKKYEKKVFNNAIEKVKIKGKKQLYVTKVFYGPDIYAEDFETVRLLEQFLMGQKSPYFQLLREEKGLVYQNDVWGMGGINAGYFAFMAITSPENQKEVMSRIDQTVNIVRNGDFSDEFLEEVKHSAVFQHAQSVVKNDFHAFNLALEDALDFPFKNYLSFPDFLENITKQNLVAAAEKYLRDGLWLLTES